MAGGAAFLLRTAIPATSYVSQFTERFLQSDERGIDDGWTDRDRWTGQIHGYSNRVTLI